MKSLNDKSRINLDKFIAKILSHSKYGKIIGDSYVMCIPDRLKDAFVFGFKEGTRVVPEAEEFCIGNFYEYFPGGKFLDKLS